MAKKKAYEQCQTHPYICWTWFEANALVLNSRSLRRKAFLAWGFSLPKALIAASAAAATTSGLVDVVRSAN